MPLNVYGTALEWIEFARNDLESADYLTNKKPLPLEIICYHCQQCAEFPDTSRVSVTKPFLK